MALRLALDTNRYRDLAAGIGEVVQELERAAQIFVPFVVLAELRTGFALGTKGRENERSFGRFLAKPGVEVVYPAEPTTRVFAEIFRQLRAQGTPIPTHDIWIAALVLEHDLVLYSRDAHFRHLPQLNTI